MGKKKQLIYILGDQRSGTTALEYILSTNPALHACGELGLLENFLRKEGRCKISRGRCTCGEVIDQCDFWKTVLADVSSQLGVEALNIRTNLKLQGSSDQLKSHIYSLYESIYHRAGKALIDSSKDLEYLKLLREVLHDWQINVVRITRQPTEVVSSIVKWRSKFGHRKVSPYYILYAWMKKNRESKIWGQHQSPNHYIEIRYEDFINQCDLTITKILKHFGYETDYSKKLILRELHTVAGTPTRFDKDEFKLSENPMRNKAVKMPIGFGFFANLCAKLYM